MHEREYVRKQTYRLKQLSTKKIIPLTDLTLHSDEGSAPYTQGNYFGTKNTYYSLTGTISFPEVKNNEQLVLQCFSSLTESDSTTNPQLKCYLDGELVQAMDVNHRDIFLDESFSGKQNVAFNLELFSGREEKQFPMYLNIAIIDKLTFEIYWDFAVALDGWRAVLNETDVAAYYLKNMYHAALLLDLRQPYSSTYSKSLLEAQKVLKETLYTHSDFNLPVEVSVVGHTHIDIAWLWTVEQAIEKGERSFSTVVKFMEEYPDYTFIQSQPQLYIYIKERYPELYENIKKKIEEKRWQPEGALWVESDINLISGESLVRQFLYGKRFLKNEFGIESKVAWLPDVFGYSATLPQIMKKTNTPYFMTTKLSWNDRNQIPHDTFYWRGLDGSEVLTHFITTISEGYSPTPHYTTYNGMLDPYTLKNSWHRYVDKSLNNTILNAYGYGDGGGGPTRGMLETAKRLKNGLPGIPKVKNSTGLDFFVDLEKQISDKDVARWTGELYFEYHRGTYTSIAKNKKNNRQSEFLIQTLEKLNVILNRSNYPREEIEQIWKKILLLQFHDILPGSSIKEVYDDSDRDYEWIFEKAQYLIEAAFTSSNSDETTLSDNREYYLFNPLAHSRQSILKLPIQSNETVWFNDEKIEVQAVNDLVSLVKIDHIPALAGGILRVQTQDEKEKELISELNLSAKEFETTFYHIILDEVGRFTSLYDKVNRREIITEDGLFNQLTVYEDTPLSYDAWDIDAFYKDKAWDVNQLKEIHWICNGPIRQSLELSYTYLDSTIKQTIHFYNHTPRIDFETEVDWHQHQQLLKVEFDVDIHTNKAVFDTQFGNLERPIHRNTSWDEARFEVSGHKWMDLSEGDYGVSLITDSKYGYNVSYKKMGISLIKSPIDPYPEADQGYHSFTYAFYPHKGSWQNSKLIQEAHELNVPIIVQPTNDTTQSLRTEPWAYVEQDNIQIDSIKLAEDSQDIIIRLFEFQNMRTTAYLKVDDSFTEAYLCDLLENNLYSLEVNEEGYIVVPFNPYEIQTIKLIV